MAFNYAAFEKSLKDEESFDYEDFEKEEEEEPLAIRDTHPGGSVKGWPSGTVAPALQFGAGNIIGETIQEAFPVEKPKPSVMGYDKPVAGEGMSEDTYKVVSGLGRVAGGALAWSTDLVTNPVKAVKDFAGFLYESGKEWNEVRKMIAGDPEVMLKLVNAFAQTPVDELALLGGIPLAAFGIRGGIKTMKGNLGKAKAKAGLKKLIEEPGDKTQPLADQLAPGVEAQMREIAKSKKIQKIEEVPDALQGKEAKAPQAKAEEVGKAPEAAKEPDVIGERQPVFAEEVSAMEAAKTAEMRAKEAEMAKKQRVPSEESQAQIASLERADAAFNEQRSYFENIKEGKEVGEGITLKSEILETPRPDIAKGAVGLKAVPKVTEKLGKGEPFVLREMDAYKNFKDTEQGVAGGSKPPEYFLAEIDGALPLQVKKTLPQQAGPVERSVGWRTNDITMRKMNWADAQTEYLKSIFDGVSKKQDIALTEILNRMNRKTAYVDPAQLMRGWMGKVENVTPEIIGKAQQIRKWYEHTFKQQNTSRGARGQKPIEYRNKYSPEIIRDMTLRERLFGFQHTMNEVMKSQQLPDFINRWPNKPWNPRELARRGGIPEMLKEQRASKLTESYANSAARDIFDSDIIANNKAVANKLDALGYQRSANTIQNWTAEVFGHVEAVMDRQTFGHLSQGAERVTRFVASRMRLGYVRGAFPANIAWNSFVQTTSSALTVGKYGTRNSAAAMFDWFGNKKLRGQIANTYAATMKSAGKGDPSAIFPQFRGKTGSITRQDINTGVSRLVKLKRGKLETATDALNYMTEVVERNITGWSIATGLRHGRGAGLKGEALWRYASDAGAKTQGMYNIENLPGVLRSGAIKTGAPFQTFSFNCWNLVKEWAGITGTPASSNMIRAKSALRFLGTATALNYISNAAIGRKPWELSSFIPFYSIALEPMGRVIRNEAWKGISTRSGLPATSGIAMEAVLAAQDIGSHGDLTRARRWLIRNVPGWFGVPAGTQINRIVDGTLAIIAGEVSNKDDETMFDVEEFQDQIKAIFGGIWTTSEAREYWEEREKELKVLPEEGIPGVLGEAVEHIPIVGDILGKEEEAW